jgi:hypothetical protein
MQWITLSISLILNLSEISTTGLFLTYTWMGLVEECIKECAEKRNKEEEDA